MQNGQGQLCWTSEIQLHNKFIEILCGVGADLPGGESGRLKKPEEDSGRGRRRRSLTRRRRRRIFKSWWGKQQEPLCKFANQRLHFIPISILNMWRKCLVYKFPLCIETYVEIADSLPCGVEWRLEVGSVSNCQFCAWRDLLTLEEMGWLCQS